MNCRLQHQWALFRYERFVCGFTDPRDALDIAAGLEAEGKRHTIAPTHTTADGGWYVCNDAPPIDQPATVKRADIFGNVIDTHATEAELNGWRPSQGALL